MESNTPSSQGAPLDATSLLHELAAAPDWQVFVDALRRGCLRLLPATRCDIYALDTDDAIELRFTTAGAGSAAPRSHFTELGLQSWFEQHGYGFAIALPLVAAGRQRGWLVLTQLKRKFLPALRQFAEQLAPLVALRLQYEQLQGECQAWSSQAARLDQRLSVAEALRLRAVLATGAAHDIGNLFTMLLGHAQLLLQDVPTHLRGDVAMVLRAAEDGRALLRRLQVTSLPATSSAEPVVALAAVIDEMVQFTRPIWERAEQRIVVQIALQDTPLVRGLAVDLREVLLNLIMNAVAAMPKGGTITISCDSVADHARLIVADTGHGIAPEQLDEIFQPLATTREHGTGLGLSVSRMIAESYGGSLTASSTPGQGAAFTLTLPAIQRDRSVSE